jgi:2,4-dienoyl-CoA reductase-like NADH-dependent reductase (Old Yellow Enzyme family)
MELLRRIERYLKSSGITPTRFGREVVRDPRLVHDLRRGREPGTAMIARVSTYLDSREQSGPVRS